MCRTAYWITLVRHEAASAESAHAVSDAPLVPWHGWRVKATSAS